MNMNLRSIFSAVVAIGLATLACSGAGGGAAPKNTQAPSARPPSATVAGAAGSTQAAPTPAASAAAGSTQAAPTPAASAAAGSTSTALTGGEATGVPSATYDSAAAQLTVPPLLTANAATAAAATGALRQWAAAASASSQYGDPDWSASQATGAPNSTPNCSDQTTAWASSDSSGVDYLELTYTTTVVPVSVNIYENNAPGSIVKVDLEEASGVTHTVYSGPPLVTTQCPRIFSVAVSGVIAHVNRVKIYFDQSVIKNWDEIDAVELVGNP